MWSGETGCLLFVIRCVGFEVERCMRNSWQNL